MRALRGVSFFSFVLLFVGCASSGPIVTGDTGAGDGSVTTDSTTTDGAPSDTIVSDGGVDGLTPVDAFPDSRTPDASVGDGATDTRVPDGAGGPDSGVMDATRDATGEAGARGRRVVTLVVEYAAPLNIVSYFHDNYEVITEPDPTACTTTTNGACDTTICPVRDGGSGDGSAMTISLGTLTISGGTGSPVVLEPPNYVVFPSTGRRWAAGDAVTFSTTGADVPAFNAPVQFPQDISMMPSAGSVALSRSGSATFSWTPTTAGETVTIRIQQGVTGRQSGVVTCEFDRSLGSGQIPAAAVAPLIAGETAIMGITTRNKRELDASGQLVTLYTSYLERIDPITITD